MKLSNLLLLLLSSIQSSLSSPQFQCSESLTELTNCGPFKIVKTSDHYKIRAQQCTADDDCAIESELITCSDICEYCNSDEIPELHLEQCTGRNNKRSCEDKIDQFLTKACSNTTVGTVPPPPMQEGTIHCIPTQSHAAITVTATKVITERILTTWMPMVNANPQKTDSLMKVDTETPVAVLGVLAGMLAVALALVLAGWVWTCWIMKKRSNRAQLYTKYQGCKEKRSYPNPTYGMSTDSQPAVVAGTARQLHSQEEENRRQTHNIINRADNQQCQEMNEMEGGGSGENHMYHVLEKPGDDDYEDPDKDLEENTTMEYEIPLPLKEI